MSDFLQGKGIKFSVCFVNKDKNASNKWLEYHTVFGNVLGWEYDRKHFRLGYRFPKEETTDQTWTHLENIRKHYQKHTAYWNKTLQDRQNAGLQYELAYYVDTRFIAILDIDDDLYLHKYPYLNELLQTAPYFLSVSKSLPKIFVIIKMPPQGKFNIHLDTEGKGMELHIGQASFAPFEGHVSNTDKTIPEFDYQELRDKIGLQPMVEKPAVIREPTPDSGDEEDDPMEIDENDSFDAPPSKYMVEKFLNSLPQIMCDLYTQGWGNICYALKAWEIDMGKKDIGRTVLHKWSARSTKYEEAKVDERWFKQAPMEKYLPFFKNLDRQYNLRIFRSKTAKEGMTHAAVARMFCETDIASRYRFCNTSFSWWYCHPTTNRWRNYGKDLCFIYQDIQTSLKGKVSDEVMLKLETTSFVRDCIPQIKPKLMIENMLELLDRPHLHAYTNGVFDMHTIQVNPETDKLEGFRTIEPHDYIFKHTNYDFPTIGDYSQEMQVWRQFFQDIYDTPEVAKYTLEVLSSCLAGKFIRDDAIFILTGKGGNGKSIIEDIISKTFGQYFVKLMVSSITKPAKGQCEFSDLASTRGSKIVFTTEPNSSDKLQNDVLKKMSGDSIMKERAFHQAADTFTINFQLFILANDLPRPADETDTGLQRRLRCMYHPYMFKPQVEYDAIVASLDENIKQATTDADRKELQKQKAQYKVGDLSFKTEKQDRKYVFAMNELLLRTFCAVKKAGDIILPEKVKEDAKDYQKDNDIKSFLDMCYDYGNAEVEDLPYAEWICGSVLQGHYNAIKKDNNWASYCNKKFGSILRTILGEENHRKAQKSCYRLKPKDVEDDTEDHTEDNHQRMLKACEGHPIPLS